MSRPTLRDMVSHRELKSGTLIWELASPGIGHLPAAAREHGKSLGRMTESAEEGAALYAQRFDFIAIGTDTQLYSSVFRSQLEDLRARCG